MVAESPAADQAVPSEAEPSSPLMVLYKDVGGALPEAPLPADEQQRFNQLCSYNILDTVSMCCVLHGAAHLGSAWALDTCSRGSPLCHHPVLCMYRLASYVPVPTLLLMHTSAQGYLCSTMSNCSFEYWVCWYPCPDRLSSAT